jgi:xanthine dehydrogenase YagR molybdenum-binding subunit
VPIEKVTFYHGDSALPDSPIAGGSNQTISIAAAVQAAIDQIHRQLAAMASRNAGSPLAGARYQDTTMRDGGLFLTGDASKGESYSAILQAAGREQIEVEAA